MLQPLLRLSWALTTLHCARGSGLSPHLWADSASPLLIAAHWTGAPSPFLRIAVGLCLLLMPLCFLLLSGAGRCSCLLGRTPRACAGHTLWCQAPIRALTRTIALAQGTNTKGQQPKRMGNYFKVNPAKIPITRDSKFRNPQASDLTRQELDIAIGHRSHRGLILHRRQDCKRWTHLRISVQASRRIHPAYGAQTSQVSLYCTQLQPKCLAHFVGRKVANWASHRASPCSKATDAS